MISLRSRDCRSYDLILSMANASDKLEPPKLRLESNGGVDTNSLADLLEFFLNYDQRVAIVRNPHVEELFQWKQKDDAEKGVPMAPFENAESRFAVGAIQAVEANNSEVALRKWITDVLQALGAAKEKNEDIAKAFGLDQSNSHTAEAENIPDLQTRRIYLTSAWIESLCTAEVRFLGWVYQDLYQKPFEPLSE